MVYVSVFSFVLNGRHGFIIKTMFNLEIPNATCRTCKHRLRVALNEYSSKVVQCCELQRSRRSNSGYKTIKVTDKACMFYKNERL